MREKAKRTFQVPHTYTIIFILMIIVAVMTWVVPSGTFATTEIDGREVTVAGTYEQMDRPTITTNMMARSHSCGLPVMPMTPWAMSTLKGFTVEAM